jgi:EthD domain
MYLARRNERLSRGEFPERWRRHGELAMSLPFWEHACGYLHNDVLADPPGTADSQLTELWTDEYDGIGQVFLPSAADMDALINARDFPVLLADEWGAFNEPVANFSILTTEESFKARRGTAMKFFQFLRPADGVDPETFRARWDAHVSLVMRSPELARLVIRYVHNHPVPMAGPDESHHTVSERIDLGLGWIGGVSELGFASRTDMEAYLSHPDRSQIRASLEQFVDLPGSLIVATNEVTMYPRTVGDH